MSANREFDESQDLLVHDCGVVIEDEYNRLTVQIRAYGDKGKNKGIIYFTFLHGVQAPYVYVV